MSPIQARIAGAGLYSVLIFATGYWLNHLGRPFPGWLVTIHKLVALAAAISLVVVVIHSNRIDRLNSVEWTVCVATFLLLLIAIVTGGLSAALGPAPVTIQVAHRIAPLLSLASAGITLWLLLSRLR